jgi:DNA repair protein SbcD/Mre11
VRRAMSVGPVSFLAMARLLHTSDWHLGRSFHREDLLGAQAGYVDHLVETIRSERVDCVVISGDLYDRALPSVDAVALCGEAMRRIHAEQVRIVLISGNHDSAQRLGFGAGLMDAAGVHVRTDPGRVGEPVFVDDVAIYGIPYLEPELLRTPWQLQSRSHTAALTEAMRRIRADLATRPAGTRSVVAAHAFVTGGEASDSERDISVGGVAQVPVSVFDDLDYVALGHLHGRQRMSESVRYSGSPLAYSFSEEHQVKGSWLVDPGRGVEFVPAPVPRKVARISGHLDDLLGHERWTGYEDHWLQVTLTDPVRPRAAMDRLRTRFPHVLALGFAPEGGPGPGLASRAARMRGRSANDLALDFVADVRGEAANDAERELLHDAFDAFRMTEAGR